MTTATAARLAYNALSLARPAGDGPVIFAASTERANRYGFALRHSGWRVENYRQNPVVLYQHDASRPPIGRADVALDAASRTLRAAVTFDRADPFAATIEAKYRGDPPMMFAVSAGFDFVDAAGASLAEWWRMTPEQIRDEAYYDLAEISTVAVPADPGAVRIEQSLGRPGGITADGAAALLASLDLDDSRLRSAVRLAVVDHIAERLESRR